MKKPTNSALIAATRGWLATYNCGCISEALAKNDLPLQCTVHMADRSSLYCNWIISVRKEPKR